MAKLISLPHTFEKYADEITITRLPGATERDLSWEEPCENGHTCNYENIQWWVDSVGWCCDCGEDHEEGHWVCPVCNVEVDPGRKPTPERQTMPGMVHYKIDDVEVGKEEFDRRLKEAVDAQG